jgi:FlgD Ig-like domain
VGRSRRGRVTRVTPRKRIRASLSVLLVGLLAALAVVIGSALHFGAGKTVRLASDNAHAPLLGASINATDLGQETSEFGRMAIVRTYYPGLPSANAWTTGLPAANKSAVIVSFKAEPTTILSGQDDTALSHFFDTAPTGNPIYWSYYHEPEGNIADGEFTLADYKAAWAHVVALANAAHNPDLHSTLILGGYDFSPSSHRSWKDYLPGGGIISTLGWDAYPPGSAKNENPIAAAPDTFMAQEIAAAKSVGLPYGFAEFGLSTAAGRPAWLSDVGNYLMHSGALFATYFNGNAQYPTLTLTDSASVAVWKGFVAKSGSNTAGPAPAPAPTSPTSPAPSAPSPTGTAPAPAADSPQVSGLALNPPSFTAQPQAHTAVTFSLNQGSDVTVLVLDQNGTVVRAIARPALAPGSHAIPYYGFNGSGHRVPTGQYQVVVVASNAHGSGTAQSSLEIDAP